MMIKKRFISFYLAIIITLFISGYLFIWIRNGFINISTILSNNIYNPQNLFNFSNNKSEIIQPNFFGNKLSLSDKSTLIDLHNFTFIINHYSCYHKKPLLLILIHSAPGNFKKRNVIRETWGQPMSAIIIFFLVGISEKFKFALEKENLRHNDLIQGNFIDVYRNMTYKHVMALKWVTYHCSSARYVLKVDDDIFVHVSALLEFLKKKNISNSKHIILCDNIRSLKVKRSWRSKWRVSPKEYPNKEYPAYCAGWAIIYSRDSVFLLYQEAQIQPFFWIDDVHVTGTLAKKINLTQTSIHPMILSKHKMNVLLQKINIKTTFLFGPPNLTENEIKALYNMLTIK